MRLDDDNLKFDGPDGRTALLTINHLLEFDRFQVMGPGNQAAHLTLHTTYRQQPGRPTIITPLTDDPLSPNNWAGTIFTADARGTFSVRYDDGTFSVTGTIDSTLATEGTPGHTGHERNGVFAFGRQHAPFVTRRGIIGPAVGRTHGAGTP